MIVVEIIFSCWLIFMSDGSAYCYCENEQPPVIERVEPQKPDRVLRLSLKEAVGDN